MEGLSTDSNRVQSYYPYLQNPGGSMSIVLRTAGDPTGLSNVVRQQVLAIDPDQPIFGVQTMGEIWDDSIAPDRLLLMLLSTFAAVALILAGVGIYGVMAYSVTQRTHEIGIRMALGASAGGLRRMVLRQGMLPVLAGLGGGILTVLWAGRVLSSLLFQVSPRDPLILCGVAVLLMAVSALACLAPAVRATRVEPMSVLRCE